MPDPVLDLSELESFALPAAEKQAVRWSGEAPWRGWQPMDPPEPGRGPGACHRDARVQEKVSARPHAGADEQGTAALDHILARQLASARMDAGREAAR